MKATAIGEGVGPGGRTPIRATLGVQAFGINAWTKDAGEQLVAEHSETQSGHEELYLVLAGSASFVVDGEQRDAPTGTAILVDPPSTRSATASEDGTTILVVGGRPGGVFRPRSWETNGRVFGLFQEGRIEEARAILLGVEEDYEDGESIAYNLACCDARLGNSEDAFEHLRRALDGRPDLAELAREDDDLASLRGDPRLAELLG